MNIEDVEVRKIVVEVYNLLAVQLRLKEKV